MSDKITQDRINLLHPSIREEVRGLVELCNSLLTQHSQMRIVQGYRTFEEQDALYAQGRTKAGKKVTAAKAGQSYHNFGLAVDFSLLIDGAEISWDVTKDWDKDGMADWMEVVRQFVKSGYKWGQSFNDVPHFEKSPYDWKVLLKRYNTNDFITGTHFVRL